MTGTSGCEHCALLYGERRDYLAGTCGFIARGRAAGEPVMVAVPGSRLEAIQAALGSSSGMVRFLDMNELGRNPGRIIPEIRDWMERQQTPRSWFIGEPIWSEQRGEEAVEATRHEALINLAFADAAINILCPYDTSSLDPRVLADAERTHPAMMCGDRSRPSPNYTDPLEMWRAADRQLGEPEQSPMVLEFEHDLGAVRTFTTSAARDTGLRGERLQDVVLAVDEAATNALVHGEPPARLRIWCAGPRLVCEVTDAGRLEDPLAGRRRPAIDWPNGRGLWLINQLCDLVELRPGTDGTTIRLHVERNLN